MLGAAWPMRPSRLAGAFKVAPAKLPSPNGEGEDAYDLESHPLSARRGKENGQPQRWAFSGRGGEETGEPEWDHPNKKSRPKGRLFFHTDGLGA